MLAMVLYYYLGTCKLTYIANDALFLDFRYCFNQNRIIRVDTQHRVHNYRQYIYIYYGTRGVCFCAFNYYIFVPYIIFIHRIVRIEYNESPTPSDGRRRRGDHTAATRVCVCVITFELIGRR